MAAALDSSYIPKEIRDVPVDPAAASKSVCMRMLALSRVHRDVLYILMHQSRNWLVSTDGIMHPGKLVAGSHSHGAELICQCLC